MFTVLIFPLSVDARSPAPRNSKLDWCVARSLPVVVFVGERTSARAWTQRVRSSSSASLLAFAPAPLEAVLKTPGTKSGHLSHEVDGLFLFFGCAFSVL